MFTKSNYLVGLLLSLITGTLLTSTESTGSRASITELHVSIGRLLLSSDSTGFGGSSNLFNREKRTTELNSRGDLSSFGITLLGLTSLTGENNELSLVSLQTLNVEFERLVGLVTTTEIDGNTNGAGFLASDTSFLFMVKFKC
jgi:hypothetical protein